MQIRKFDPASNDVGDAVLCEDMDELCALIGRWTSRPVRMDHIDTAEVLGDEVARSSGFPQPHWVTVVIDGVTHAVAIASGPVASLSR